jgi:hypothetical protein
MCSTRNTTEAHTVHATAGTHATRAIAATTPAVNNSIFIAVSRARVDDNYDDNSCPRWRQLCIDVDLGEYQHLGK